MIRFSNTRMTSKKIKIKEETDRLHLVPLSIEEVVTNEDLLKEILLCLPTKSLLRYKCVSKQWLRIISSARFAFNQFARNTSLISAIYFEELFEIEARGFRHVSLQPEHSIPPVSFLDGISKEYKTYLLHSSNGLMLCSHGSLYTVSNFTTQKYALLPQLEIPYSWCDQVLACLAFDPEKSPYYKVVLVIHQRNTNSYRVEIFSSESGSFKRVSMTAPGGQTLPLVAYWDGAVHWMNTRKLYFRFEVDTEQFTTTLLPAKPKILSKNKIRYFGECGGHLLLIQYQSDTQMQFRVLEMKKGTSVWTLMYKVKLKPVIEEDAGAVRNHTFMYEHLHEQNAYRVLGAMKESHESGLALILFTQKKLISYNLKFKKVDILADFGPEVTYWRYFPYSRPFIESLCPVEFGPRILHD